MQQHVWLLQSGLKACSGTLPAKALYLGIEDRALTLFMSAMSFPSVRSCSFMSPVKFFSFLCTYSHLLANSQMTDSDSCFSQVRRLPSQGSEGMEGTRIFVLFSNFWKH